MIAQNNGLNIKKILMLSTKRIIHNNTLIKLIFCTKSGPISYISEAHAGSCTDRFITEDTNISAIFTPGFMVLFDKGFNVQDLFLSRQVKCVLPPSYVVNVSLHALRFTKERELQEQGFILKE